MEVGSFLAHDGVYQAISSCETDENKLEARVDVISKDQAPPSKFLTEQKYKESSTSVSKSTSSAAFTLSLHEFR